MGTSIAAPLIKPTLPAVPASPLAMVPVSAVPHRIQPTIGQLEGQCRTAHVSGSCTDRGHAQEAAG